MCQRQSRERSVLGFASAFLRIAQSAHLCFFSAMLRPLLAVGLKLSRLTAEFLNVGRRVFHRTGIALAITAASIALGGCGSASNNPISNGNRLDAEARLTAINANMTIAMTSNPSTLPQLTQDYIAAVQTSESLLGAELARQKLATTASLLATACPTCVQSLNAAAAQITS